MRLIIMKKHPNQYKKNQTCGFSMLEILISILILSIGLLGLAALHATSLKANHGAYYKSQATFLAYDIVDRMRANRPEAINGSYNLLLTDINLSGSTLAVTDVNSWLANVGGLLPTGDGSINCTAAGACTVVVTWDVQREGGTAQNATVTTQQFTFQTSI